MSAGKSLSDGSPKRETALLWGTEIALDGVDGRNRLWRRPSIGRFYNVQQRAKLSVIGKNERPDHLRSEFFLRRLGWKGAPIFSTLSRGRSLLTSSQPIGVKSRQSAGRPSYIPQ